MIDLAFAMTGSGTSRSISVRSSSLLSKIGIEDCDVEVDADGSEVEGPDVAEAEGSKGARVSVGTIPPAAASVLASALASGREGPAGAADEVDCSALVPSLNRSMAPLCPPPVIIRPRVPHV